MRILKINDEKVCVEFKLINGLKENFIQLFEYYQENVLYFYDDELFTAS